MTVSFSAWQLHYYFPDTLRGLAKLGSSYLAAGSGGAVVTSSDGAMSWRATTGTTTPFDLNAVTYGAGKFVAVGSSAGPSSPRRTD